MIEAVTLAKLLRFDDELVLPEELVQKIFDEGKIKKTCMVLTLSSGAIKIFPITSDSAKVIKLTLTIGTLSPNFLQEVANTMYRYNVNSLFNTGLCFQGERCLYEAYFTDIPDKAGFKNVLEGISSVIEVKFETID
ncbi:MAG: hypothetical protein ACFFD4_35825 [Candidatus Odinarchaeota archaeon]